MTDTLVVQTAWLGDAILSTPLLKALGEQYGKVDVVTTPAAAPLLETHPAVGRIVLFDKRHRDRGLIGLVRTARKLRRSGYERVYLAQGSWRSALLALLAGIRERIGFADATGRALYTRRATPTGDHEAIRLRSLATTTPGYAEPTLSLTNDDLAAARAALADAGVSPPFVVLAPGSARANKRWPHFGHLAQRIATHCPVVIVGGPPEARSDTQPCDHAVADLRGLLPIRQSAAVVALAVAAVTNDSAPLHIAQAVGTPVVGLFGPTDPTQGFGPRGPFDHALGVDGLACRPCSTHGGRRCPLGHHRCLRDLDPDSVHEVVLRVIRSTCTPSSRGFTPRTVRAT